jgi:hypothetical protein
MPGRALHGMPKTFDDAGVSFTSHEAASPISRRRTIAALVSGATLVAIGLWGFGPTLAAGISRAGDSPIAFFLGQSARSRNSEWGGRAIRTVMLDPDAPARHMHSNAAKAAKAAHETASFAAPGRSVCVRLCDGYFFPNAGPADGDADSAASCASLCPGAPTEVFYQPSGSDAIDDATSASGKRYTALPVAFRYRAKLDNTCSCGGNASVDQSLALLNDMTLRKGDSVMTAAGVRVFRGAGYAPYGLRDFTALAQTSMPRDKRDVLIAIERASRPRNGTTVVAIAQPRRRVASAATPARSGDEIRFISAPNSAN